MVKKTFKLLLLWLAVLSFACATLVAQNFASHQPIGVHVNPSPMRTPAQHNPAGVKTLYSNLGPSTDAYYDADGWLVTGPLSILGESQWIGLPFTVSVNATVDALEAAVGYDGSGANGFLLGLYSDNGGTVGTLLSSGGVKNAPSFGSCCALSVAKLNPPVSITAGTQYWIVAYTPSSGGGDDFYGAWAFANADHFDYSIDNDGWTDSLSFTGIPAGAVLGTVP